MYRVRLLLALLLIALVATGVATAQDEHVLVIGHAEATDSLDPARGYNQTTGIILKATYNTLVTFPSDNTDEILPSLATDWEMSDDGMTYTFTLRDDVVFANGDPLTADDVVFSIKRLQNVTGNPSFLAASIGDVVAVDDTHVEITLATANADLLRYLANGAFSIVNADQVMENGGTDADDAADTDTAEEWLNDNSAGSGPYILTGWDPQVETELVRNENYWGEQPYFDRIIIQNIGEAATQKATLEAGDIDMALDLTRDQVGSFDGNADFTVTSAPSNYTHFLLMNENADLCGATADPQVQEAIRLALDYEGYLDLWGGVTPAAPTAAALYSGYGSDHASQRDLDQARQLLADAGYPDGLDLTLEYPTFTFQGVNMDTNAQKIQSDLAEAGINVTLDGGDIQTKLESYRSGSECFGYWFWGPDVIASPDAFSFLPNGIVGLRAGWTDESADPTIVDLREQTRAEGDPDTSVDLYAQIYDYLQESGPFAPLIQADVYTAFKSTLQGYVWHPQWTLDLSLLSEADA